MPLYPLAGGGGGGIWSPVVVYEGSSSVAAVDIGLGDSPLYKIWGKILPTVAGSNLIGRVTLDNFDTVQAGSTDYTYYQRFGTASPSTGQTTAVDANAMVFGVNIQASSARQWVGEILAFFPSDGETLTRFLSRSSRVNDTPRFVYEHGADEYQADSVVNGLRLAFSAGLVASHQLYVTSLLT